MAEDFLIAFAAAMVAVLVAFAAIFLVDRRRARLPLTPRLDRAIEPIVFLFRDRVLIDATPPARSLLAASSGGSDWQRLSAWISMRMPQSAGQMSRLTDTPRLELTELSEGSSLRLLAEDLGDGVLRITLTDPGAEDAGIVVDSLSFAAMEHELEILRSTMDLSPMLAWRLDRQGNVTWANLAYLDQTEARLAGETVWPLPQLIDISARPATSTVAPAMSKSGSTRRVQLEHGGQIRWFDCHTHEVADQTVAIALPADAAVRAERSLREFVQTLTKTFADLPIGLAIFDRDRNLQLFNPALIDLTGLATGFLTGRPTLYAFLDRLREARMVPEPKDYRSWRNQMNSLEAAASSGHHVEVWSLPGGQTYRVTGRPHPDGAIAFLFEDITSEISLTRKFRADISLSGEVLDALEVAVAVFSAHGDLLISNRHYNEMWSASGRHTLNEHQTLWGKACGDSPGLRALCDALGAPLPDEPVGGAMAGPSGGLLSWRIRPLLGGSFLLKFGSPMSGSGTARMMQADGIQDKAQVQDAKEPAA